LAGATSLAAEFFASALRPIFCGNNFKGSWAARNQARLPALLNEIAKGIFMLKPNSLNSLSLAAIVVLGSAVHSLPQDATVPLLLPATKLESFETNVGILVIKGSTEIGSVSGSGGDVTVKCREVTDAVSGRKERGVAVEIFQQGQLKDRLLIDYDELDPLLRGVDTLGKIDASVTSLDSFDAAFTTRGGLRLAALGNRSTGAFRFGMRDLRLNLPPIAFSREQMVRFSSLMVEAKKKLDSTSGGQ
jgi:hypothetical protein